MIVVATTTAAIAIAIAIATAIPIVVALTSETIAWGREQYRQLPVSGEASCTVTSHG